MQQHAFSSMERITPQLIMEVAEYSRDLKTARRMLELLDPPFRDARQLASDVLTAAGEASSVHFVGKFIDGPHHWFKLEELLAQNRTILKSRVFSIADCGVLYANYLAITDRDLSNLSLDMLREIALPLNEGIALPFRDWLFDQLSVVPELDGLELSDFDLSLVKNEEADQEIVLAHLAALERIGVVTDEIWSAMDSGRAFELQYRLDVIENSSIVLTVEQGKMVYFSIRGHLDGVGRSPLYIVDKIPGFPFRWILWDDDDELEDVLTIQENKEEAFGSGDLELPIEPLPTYPFNSDPARWLTEALAVNFSDRKLQKVLLYALNAGIRFNTLDSESKAILPRVRDLVDSFNADGSEVMKEKKNEALEAIEGLLKIEKTRRVRVNTGDVFIVPLFPKRVDYSNEWNGEWEPKDGDLFFLLQSVAGSGLDTLLAMYGGIYEYTEVGGTLVELDNLPVVAMEAWNTDSAKRGSWKKISTQPIPRGMPYMAYEIRSGNGRYICADQMGNHRFYSDLLGSPLPRAGHSAGGVQAAAHYFLLGKSPEEIQATEGTHPEVLRNRIEHSRIRLEAALWRFFPEAKGNSEWLLNLLDAKVGL